MEGGKKDSRVKHGNDGFAFVISLKRKLNLANPASFRFAKTLHTALQQKRKNHGFAIWLKALCLFLYRLACKVYAEFLQDFSINFRKHYSCMNL